MGEFIVQALVVQKLDSAFQWISIRKTNYAIQWIEIYPMDSAIRLKNYPSETDKSSRYKSGVQINLIRLSALDNLSVSGGYFVSLSINSATLYVDARPHG